MENPSLANIFGKIKFFLFSGLDNQAFYNALHEESLNGDAKKVKYLLKSGKNVDLFVDCNGYTPLLLASFKGNAEVVKLLIEAGADVNIDTGGGYTPLLEASSKGHAEVVKLLIEAGADVDRADDVDGETSLITASKWGYTEIVKLLINSGVDVDTVEHNNGMTSLFFASRDGHTEVVKHLLEAGADVDKADDYGNTSLWIASCYGHAEVVKLLLEVGADVNKANHNGETPLNQAAQEGHAEVVKFLTDAGADLEAVHKQIVDKHKKTNDNILKKRSSNGIEFLFEDIRANRNNDAEIIVNLWHITTGNFITSLKVKAYIASGSDEEKMNFLKTRASSDFNNAQGFPVPKDFKADVIIDGISSGNACTHETLEFMGGYPALFRETLLDIPVLKNCRFNPHQAMLCITALKEDEDGYLSCI